MSSEIESTTVIWNINLLCLQYVMWGHWITFLINLLRPDDACMCQWTGLSIFGGNIAFRQFGAKPLPKLTLNHCQFNWSLLGTRLLKVMDYCSFWTTLQCGVVNYNAINCFENPHWTSHSSPLVRGTGCLCGCKISAHTPNWYDTYCRSNKPRTTAV